MVFDACIACCLFLYCLRAVIGISLLPRLPPVLGEGANVGSDDTDACAAISFLSFSPKVNGYGDVPRPASHFRKPRFPIPKVLY